MICPLCAYKDHPPGSDECGWCRFPLAAVDAPVPVDRVDQSLMFDPVHVLLPRAPVTVSIEASIGTAMRLMLQHRVGAVLVTDENDSLHGILTERDFLTKVATLPRAEFLPLRPWMTPRPETVERSAPIAVALGKMQMGRYRHLPVMKEAHPVGVISVRDILRHIIQLCSPARQE